MKQKHRLEVQGQLRQSGRLDICGAEDTQSMKGRDDEPTWWDEKSVKEND